ncbi:MAG TPA: heme o synthase [Candidatus Saccharimonadales bacterium]|nr:heme o synthase [Candidatus Saccharimonadales bacterium]
MSLLKDYYELAKPERTYANIMTAGAGFLLASRWHINWALLVYLLVGTSLVIGSACVVNNYIDREIDKKMARTKKRPLAVGRIPLWNAITYAVILGVVGFGILALYVNWLVVAMGVIAYIDYVVLYGIAKRKSTYGTIVGSVSGSMSMAAGYVAVSGRIDGAAVLLFAIMTLWQMPHFYSIAMYRLKDYTAAGIPVLPSKIGMRNTKIRIILYIIAFMVASMLLTAFGYANDIYFTIAAAVSVYWLWQGLQTFEAAKDEPWARKMFFTSLTVLTVLCLGIAIGSI